MTLHEIITKVKTLHFPEGSYIVFGSCPMAAAGLREAGDIDMLVTKELFNELKQSGWTELVKNENDRPLTMGDFEAHYAWDFSSYKPTLEQLLLTADVIDGIPFASLLEVRKWKLSSGRPKDFDDIKLIDNHISMIN